MTKQIEEMSDEELLDIYQSEENIEYLFYVGKYEMESDKTEQECKDESIEIRKELLKRLSKNKPKQAVEEFKNRLVEEIKELIKKHKQKVTNEGHSTIFIDEFIDLINNIGKEK